MAAMNANTNAQIARALAELCPDGEPEEYFLPCYLRLHLSDAMRRLDASRWTREQLDHAARYVGAIYILCMDGSAPAEMLRKTARGTFLAIAEMAEQDDQTWRFWPGAA